MAKKKTKLDVPLGAIVLILIGLVGLLQNYVPGFSLWPLLIIAIGAAWIVRNSSR